MQTLIIINNAAAKARRVWPGIRHQLNSAKLSYQVIETTAPGDATIKTRAALRNGITNIAVVGGDGTLSEAAEGFFEFNQDLDIPPAPVNPQASLSILPAGTGDDFARGLSESRTLLQERVEKLIRQSQNGAATSIDVLYGRCNDFAKPFVCLNASTMGIGGETATRVAAQGQFMRHFPGEFRFLLAALAALAVWRERRVRVTVDGRVVGDGPMNLIGVSNALYAGGGMKLSPEAQFDDGQLDVVTATGLSRANIMVELARVHKGGHVKNPKVNISQGQIVRVETFLLQDAMPLEADGNVRGQTPVQFQVMPNALRFVI